MNYECGWGAEIPADEDGSFYPAHTAESTRVELTSTKELSPAQMMNSTPKPERTSSETLELTLAA